MAITGDKKREILNGKRISGSNRLSLFDLATYRHMSCRGGIKRDVSTLMTNKSGAFFTLSSAKFRGISCNDQMRKLERKSVFNENLERLLMGTNLDSFSNILNSSHLLSKGKPIDL